MSISLAFKYGSPTDFLDICIKQRTGGVFSHVELWLSGEGKQAVCYSSRANGTSIEVLDITDIKTWNVVPVPFPENLENALYWFCVGSSGRAYDGLGLVGIGFDMQLVHDPYDRFCSEACFEAIQSVGKIFPPTVGPRWMVSPSGHPRGGFGLFELLNQVIVKG